MDTDIAKSISKILQEAEGSVRTLIGKAAESQKYDDIVVLVRIARQLNELATRSPDANSATVASASSLPVRSDTIARPPPRRGQRARVGGVASPTKRYPAFSTTRERLIKLGWSKKNRTEYEHRAPKASVSIVYEAIRNIGANGDALEVEALSPLVTADNQEIPAYQIYMAIGWLRDLGAVQKSGRNRYRVTSSGFGPFESYWTRSLTER
jgi:hypothetical protein